MSWSERLMMSWPEWHCQINSLRVQMPLPQDFRQRWSQPSTQQSRRCETGEESIEKSGDVGR